MIKRLKAIILLCAPILCSQNELGETDVLPVFKENKQITQIISAYLSTWELSAILVGHTKPVYTLTYSPDNKFIASGAGDNTVKMWDTKTGAHLQTLTSHKKAVFALAFSPDGRTLASGSEDNTIKIWTTISYRLLKTISGHTSCVRALAFSPNHKQLASGSSDSVIHIWDRQNRYVLLYTLRAHQNPLVILEYTPTDLISASCDGIQNTWSHQKKYNLVHTNRANQAEHIILNSQDFAFECHGPHILIKDGNTNKLIQQLTNHADAILALAISPSGKYLASGSFDTTVRLWRNKSELLAPSSPRRYTSEPPQFYSRKKIALDKELDDIGKIGPAKNDGCVIC